MTDELPPVPDTAPTVRVTGETMRPDTPAPAVPSPSCTAIGPYRVLKELGEGSMGTVYQAYDDQLQRTVALKVLRPSLAKNAGHVERFEREARAAAGRHHPNITPIYDVGCDGDRHFYTMEYVEGKTFRQLLDEKKLTLHHSLAIIIEVAKALEYAHGQGLVHRNVKPGNIMVNVQGRVLLLDFGLARHAADAQLTRTGDFVGTPAYTSPEQAAGKIVDGKTDIYALGAILYELLTGRPPFTGQTVATILKQVLADEPVPPHVVDRAAPRDLEIICGRAMDKNRARRYSTVREFYEDIIRHLNDEPIQAKPVSVFHRAYRRARKHKELTLSLGVVVLLAIGFGSYYGSRKIVEQSRWRPVFTDNFHRPALGADWSAFWGGQWGACPVDTALSAMPWQIKAHKLYGHGGSPTYLVCNREFRGDIRAEIDITVMGGQRGALTFVWSGDPDIRRSNSRVAGYSFMFGADEMTSNRFFKTGLQLGHTRERLPAAGRRYRITLERRGYNLSVRLNDKVLFAVKDYEPLAHDKHNRLMLVLRDGNLLVHRVRVWRAVAPLRAGPMVVADRLYAAGNYREALAAYQDLLAAYPDAGFTDIARYKAGRCNEMQGDPAQAREHYARLVQEQPRSPLAPLALARKGICIYSQGRQTEARMVFEQCLRHYPLDPALREISRLFASLGDTARDRRDYPAAIDCYNRAQHYTVRPDERYNRIHLCWYVADCLTRQGEYDRADSVVRQAITQYPEQRYTAAGLLLSMANHWGQQPNQQARALSCFNRIEHHYADIHGAAAAALNSRAAWYQQRGDLPAATECYRRVHEEYPAVRAEAAQALLRLAEIFNQQGDVRKTEYCVRTAMQQYGDVRSMVATAQLFKAKLYRARGSFGEAIGIYKQMYRTYREDPRQCLELPHEIMHVYLQWGRYAEAAAFLDSVDILPIGNDREDLLTAMQYYHAALACQLLNDYDQTRAIYTRALAACPNEFVAPLARLMLGTLDIESFKKKWGIGDIKTFASTDRAFDVAEWYLMRKEKKKALAWYKRVVELDPTGNFWRELAERRMDELKGKNKK
jgi:serine/threonine protein kinase/tetratricopeptide (TPR) repeat protein